MKIALIVFASLLALLACAGVFGNVVFMAQGGAVPADPAQRIGFLAGMWACPAFLLIAAIGVAIAAFAINGGKRRR